MLKFISLGSGSSGNCYYFEQDGDAMLIDAGVGIRNIKKFLHDKGISIDSVKRILITHDHADHIKSVGVISTEYDIPVYATSDVHAGILRNYCVPKKIPGIHQQVIEKDVRVKLGNFYVTPFTVPHDSSGNVGYRIEVDNGTEEGLTFCLMTDVGHVTEEMQKYITEKFSAELQNTITACSKKANPLEELGKTYFSFFVDNPNYYHFCSGKLTSVLI